MRSTAAPSSASPSSLKMTPRILFDSNHPSVSVSRINPATGLTMRSKEGFPSFSFGILCCTSISKKLFRDRSERLRSWHKRRRNANSGRGLATPLTASATASSSSSALAVLASRFIVASSTLEKKDIVLGSRRSGWETFMRGHSEPHVRR